MDYLDKQIEKLEQHLNKIIKDYEDAKSLRDFILKKTEEES